MSLVPAPVAPRSVAPEGDSLSRASLGWYSLGAVPGGIYLTVATFIVFYYNQVLGVAGSTVGFAILLASLFDGVTDPIVGALSDRTQSRLGRRHPYMLASSLPLGIVFYLLWVPPDGLSERGLTIWLVTLLLIHRLLATFFTVPYFAFGAELTRDYHERTRLTTARSYISNIGRASAGGLMLLYFLRPTDAYPNGQLNPQGYPDFALLFGAATAACLGLSAWMTRVEGQRMSRAAESLSLAETLSAPIRDLRDAFAHRPFRALTIGVLLQYTAFGVSDALGLYMSTFFWGVSAQLFFVWGIGMFSGMYVGFDLWRRVGRRIEKRTVYLIGTIGYLVCFISPYVLKAFGWWPSSESAIYFPLYVATTGFLAHVFSAGPTIMTGSMLGDITDLDELENGSRREGVIFGAESLAYKMFIGLGPVLAGFVIDSAGIVPDMDPSQVPANAVMTLGLGQGGVSAALFILSLLFVRQYDLSAARHHEILARLDARREAEL